MPGLDPRKAGPGYPCIHQQHQHNKVQMGSRESRAVVWCGGGVQLATRPGNAKYSAESLSHHIRRGPARLQGYKLPILTFEPSNFVDFPYPPPHPNICWPTTTTLPAPYHGFPPHPCYPSPRQARREPVLPHATPTLRNIW